MIGVFDSGSGGLTVLRQIRERMPQADIVYFGDIKHAPYGLRSREELSALTVAAIKRLTAHGATSVVSACNSVSASLVASNVGLTTRLIEMVEPTVASLQGMEGRILVCATPATIDSKIYQNAFHRIGKEVATLAIPALAGAIEQGASESELRTILTEAFANCESYDVLLLACTHYPLMLPLFTEVVGADKVIIDPADAVARKVAQQWGSDEIGTGSLTFLISQDSLPFRTLVARLFADEQIRIEVVE